MSPGPKGPKGGSSTNGDGANDDGTNDTCGGVYQSLETAYLTGQQVTIGLHSGKKLEGVIVEALWETSFRVWLEPAEPVEVGEDIDKAIVGVYAVESVEFGVIND